MLALSTKEMRQNRIKRFMKWLMERTDVEDALQRLDELTQETRTTVAEHSAVIRGVKHAAARERLRSWLSPPNPSINHDMACSAHRDGTATWFTHGTSFRDWKST
jgi:hypothetical protein